MPWVALGKGDDLVKKVAKNFDVKGVPRLIMLNSATGEVLDDNCLKLVEKSGPVAI